MATVPRPFVDRTRHALEPTRELCGNPLTSGLVYFVSYLWANSIADSGFEAIYFVSCRSNLELDRSQPLWPVASERDTRLSPRCPSGAREGQERSPDAARDQQSTPAAGRGSGQRVEVRRSSRRTRTVLYRDATPSSSDPPAHVEGRRADVRQRHGREGSRREARTSAPRGDDALADRVRELGARSWFQLWTSCPSRTLFVGDESAAAMGLLHTQHRRHRLSHRLQPMPAGSLTTCCFTSLPTWWNRHILIASGAWSAGIRRRRCQGYLEGYLAGQGRPVEPSMSTEQAARRRAAVVLARYDASSAAPDRTDPAASAAACLLDAYEVLRSIGVISGIAGPPSGAEMLSPGALRLPTDITVPAMADQLSETADELVVLPADLPDLPGLVLAKLFKVLHGPTSLSRRTIRTVSPRWVCRCRWPIGFLRTHSTWTTIRLCG